MARIVFVFVDDHSGNMGLLQLGNQRGHCRTVVEDHHVILGVGRFLRQLGLETFLEKRNQINWKNQEEQHHTDELGNDDVDDHQRMLPGKIAAIAGG